MKFYSQAGQDRFVYRLLGDIKGTFLDIGCSHPIDHNNTYALEQAGWKGILIDQDDYSYSLKDLRTSKWIHGNATQQDWSEILKPLGIIINYLSLDIDSGSYDALVKLPFFEIKFDIITIEHDAYRFGDSLRLPERKYLKSFGYDLVSADIKDKGAEFEDWWVRSGVFAEEILTPFRSSKKDWKEVLGEA